MQQRTLPHCLQARPLGSQARARGLALGLLLTTGLYGYAISADLRLMMTNRVPAKIHEAIVVGAIDSKRDNHVAIRPHKLEGWVIESFTVPGTPPLPSAAEVYKGGKDLLVTINKRSIEHDPYFALSTHWMVDKCNTWVTSVRRSYEELIKASALKIAPVRCTRIVKPDGSQVFDVVSFRAESGSFTDTEDTRATAHRLRPWNVYGPSVRGVEPEAENTTSIDGFIVTQHTARRYTYRTTFMHAEFGKKRIGDTYVLMIASPSVLTAVQAVYPVELQEKDLWNGVAVVLEALYQERKP